MKASTLALALSAVCATTAFAQTPSTQSQSRQQERVESILGALFGARGTDTTSLDAQWTLGRTPLAQQRTQFDSRLDADVRGGVLAQGAADRAKADYRALVELEARYGADRRFTATERADLTERYDQLTRLVADGGFSGGISGKSVADGRQEFEARVDESVRARRLTRTQATQLKGEYASLIRLEADYLRDGALSVRERDDLETKLDALDAKVGDAPTTPARALEPRERLDAIAKALPNSGLSATDQARLRVEHEDLVRLASAYQRLSVTADERAYLERRLTDLETRSRVRR